MRIIDPLTVQNRENAATAALFRKTSPPGQMVHETQSDGMGLMWYPVWRRSKTQRSVKSRAISRDPIATPNLNCRRLVFSSM